MSVGLSPIQLVVLSGLLQDRGLRLPTTLTSRIDSLKDTTTLFGRLSYIAYHPKTVSSYSTILTALRTVPGLSGTVPADYTATLPVGVRPRDVVGSIRARADALLANGLKGLLDNITLCTGVMSNSFGVQGSVDQYKDAKFSDFYLNAQNYTDLLSHGISSTFGSSARGTVAAAKAADQRRLVTATEIASNLNVLIKAIKNLGNLYDFTDLNTVGHASALITNLYKQGVYNRTNIGTLMKQYGYDVKTISTKDDLGLTQLLQQIIGQDITTILKATGATVPNVTLIASAADFLEARRVLPADVAEMLPKQELSQLGKKLTSLGITSTNINTILTQLADIEIAELPYLNELKQPLPAADVSVIQTQLVNGSGHFSNATLDNMLGVLTGNYNSSLDVLVRTNIEFTKSAQTTSLMSAAKSVMDKLVAGQTVESGDITALTSAISVLANLTSATAAQQNITAFYNQLVVANEAVTTIIDALRLEVDNGELAGMNFNSNIEVFTTPTLIDSFALSQVQSARYFITVQNNNKLDVSENLVVHNGTLANVATYGQATIGADSLGHITAAINSTDKTCDVYYTASEANDYHYFLKQKVDYTPAHDGADANTLKGSIAEISTVQRLDEIAVDSNYTGVGTLLASMASNDIYGDAILASLSTARNAKKLSTIGIETPKANPQNQLKDTLAKQGNGLTDDQKKAIIAQATAAGIDPELALSNASKHGFFSAFYTSQSNFG